jgi:sterol 3beta-glucosyltransferase
VSAMGAGPDPIPRKHMTVERLATAIRRAVTDAGLRDRAARLGTAIQREHGVTEAVEHFERSIERSS